MDTFIKLTDTLRFLHRFRMVLSPEASQSRYREVEKYLAVLCGKHPEAEPLYQLLKDEKATAYMDGKEFYEKMMAIDALWTEEHRAVVF